MPTACEIPAGVEDYYIPLQAERAISRFAQAKYFTSA